ncbi:MAG: transaldolase [Gammaproteobacteria bacterium]|nr:transaldolase [Gammaproteobacteria bacterium]NNF62111.1 transaldolase [Gammaproteobacteria bacterium]NNM20495.1 transaldolase [Gammaproteobacteria bacterium]
MSENPLLELKALGQSIWLDYIERDLLGGGGLARLIEDDGIAGVTSNPSIFHQAITSTGQYDKEISTLADSGAVATTIYNELVISDIRQAADILHPVYTTTAGQDGYVSLEVSPHLANETDASLEQARSLWQQVDRQNLMIKIPGTPEGLPAIEQLVYEGINVNVTLLFSVTRYAEVARAYLRGLQRRLDAGLPLDSVASVASFFLSRIDSAIDKQLPQDHELRGSIAIASARSAYITYQKICASDEWHTLAAAGARPQRLLWASTSTKNPAYSDTLYVDELIGPETVNTVPPKTLDAYRDHGKPAVRVTDGATQALQAIAALPDHGIDLETVTTMLESDGVNKFIASFDSLMQALESERVRLKSA